MKTFSIIIPAYEDGAKLENNLIRLNEIKRKEYPKMEIIVSVRTSKDNTEEIARLFADKVIKTKGLVSESRNDGASEATGEILVFLDADSIPNFGTLTEISRSCGINTVGTCTSRPNLFGWRPFLATSLQNILRALHIFKGSGLLFCHRSIFFEKNIKYDPAKNIGEHHDFLQRAEWAGAEYKYLRLQSGFEVDVRRYEKMGYFRSFLFWFLFFMGSYFMGRRAVDKLSDLYWSNKKITLREILKSIV